ncbi:MAG: nucleotide exchange factor GrpE [Gammaproteobacteria bacterium]|nr:nucleotide exchange factor GrpE [Gammaproteobacteria bacterium]
MSDKETEANVEQDIEAAKEQAEIESEAQAQPDDAGENLAGKLAEAEKKAEENWDKLVRTQAEMDNLRRRTERELENAHKFALEKIAQELLGVRDSLEMGLAAAQAENAELASLTEGTELTLKMLTSLMEKFAIKEVHPLDEPFNPELHQAVSMIPAPDKAANTVINVMQKGYTLNERLIRPAMVVVSNGEGAATAEQKGSNVDEEA